MYWTPHSPYWSHQGLYGHEGDHSPGLLNASPKISFQSSSSYFLGDAKNDSLQRIYGISFPDKKLLTEYKQFLLEAAKRDHRKIGKVSHHFLYKQFFDQS
jgi:threonyl-tRNA synthetase